MVSQANANKLQQIQCMCEWNIDPVNLASLTYIHKMKKSL
jgi:hypothetical protein